MFDARTHARQWARDRAAEARAEAWRFLADAKALRAAGADPARIMWAACLARMLNRQAIGFRQVANLLAGSAR